MKRKILIRIALFCVLFGFVFSALTRVLTPKWLNATQYASFAKRPDGYADVLFVGSSSVHCNVSPLVMWDEFGISSQVRASKMQMPPLTRAIMEDALRRQHPKLVVMSALLLFEQYDVNKFEPLIHQELDAWPLSPLKIDTVGKLSETAKQAHTMGYFLPFFRYHDRWNELKPVDFKGVSYDGSHGQHEVYAIRRVQPLGGMSVTDEPPLAANPRALAYYQQTIELCKAAGVPVVILSTPRVDWSYGMHLSTKALADQYGLVFIDCNTREALEALNLDFGHDFYADDHLNIYGSIKFSKYLGDILSREYDLPDRRSDGGIAKGWNDDLRDFKEELATREPKLVESNVQEEEDAP